MQNNAEQSQKPESKLKTHTLFGLRITKQYKNKKK